MADKSGIEWTDATWNPLVGCEHVSAGCDGCYAARDAAGRLSGHEVYAGLAVRGVDGVPRFTGEVRLLRDRLDQPLRWKRPRRVFVNSQSDLFHRDVPDGFIAEVFGVMAAARRHSFQLLTKRPQRMAALLAQDSFVLDVVRCLLQRYPDAPGMTWPLPNVWVGVSVESQVYDFRVEYLRKTPAAVRWVSVEPLVGPITAPHKIVAGMDWIVAGGESGPRARPMHPDWLRALRDECEFRDVAFLVKQWGEWAPIPPNQYGHGDVLLDRDGTVRAPEFVEHAAVLVRQRSYAMHKVGKRAAGRELDGKVWDEYPAVPA